MLEEQEENIWNVGIWALWKWDCPWSACFFDGQVLVGPDSGVKWTNIERLVHSHYSWFGGQWWTSYSAQVWYLTGCVHYYARNFICSFDDLFYELAVVLHLFYLVSKVVWMRAIWPVVCLVSCFGILNLCNVPFTLKWVVQIVDFWRSLCHQRFFHFCHFFQAASWYNFHDFLMSPYHVAWVVDTFLYMRRRVFFFIASAVYTWRSIHTVRQVFFIDPKVNSALHKKSLPISAPSQNCFNFIMVWFRNFL